LGFRAAFAPYSGLITFAGFALIVVFGSKFIKLDSALADATPEKSVPAVVTQVAESTCTRSMSSSIQSFSVKLRCLEVDVEEPAFVRRHIVVEQAGVGSLAAGDHVYVVPANTGFDRYLIINAGGRWGFYAQQFSALGVVLLGVLMIVVSFLIKRQRPAAAVAPPP
jgi:hypothetical protein